MLKIVLTSYQQVGRRLQPLHTDSQGRRCLQCSHGDQIPGAGGLYFELFEGPCSFSKTCARVEGQTR